MQFCRCTLCLCVAQFTIRTLHAIEVVQYESRSSATGTRPKEFCEGSGLSQSATQMWGLCSLRGGCRTCEEGVHEKNVCAVNVLFTSSSSRVCWQLVLQACCPCFLCVLIRDSIAGLGCASGEKLESTISLCSTTLSAYTRTLHSRWHC